MSNDVPILKEDEFQQESLALLTLLILSEQAAEENSLSLDDAFADF